MIARTTFLFLIHILDTTECLTLIKHRHLWRTPFRTRSLRMSKSEEYALGLKVRLLVDADTHVSTQKPTMRSVLTAPWSPGWRSRFSSATPCRRRTGPEGCRTSCHEAKGCWRQGVAESSVDVLSMWHITHMMLYIAHIMHMTLHAEHIWCTCNNAYCLGDGVGQGPWSHRVLEGGQLA